MVKLAIYPYNIGSRSAALLKKALNCLLIKRRGSRFRWRRGWTVVNWGCSELPPGYLNVRVLNHPQRVRSAAHKTRAFEILRQAGVSIPDFTTSRQEALGWLRTGDVCARATPTGHEGIGLSIHPRGSNDLPEVPLYTKYIKKIAEYRVHIFRGRVIHLQRKLRRLNSTGDTRIRNTANGYVFSSNMGENDFGRLENVRECALAAVRALGLDFGAVDVIYNQHHNRAYVLEVNTAPGIEGVTLEKYAENIRGVLRNEGIHG